MSQSTICFDTEIRKLRPAELYKLGQILSIQDSWKKLMAIIPKDNGSNLPKFNVEHFSMIEQAAQQGNAAELFLSEWGTIGKRRPTLGYLLSLLTKAQLFRAADYVAGELLNEELPKRPQYGPAAPVDISNEIKRLLEDKEELENFNFNESLVFELPTQVDDNETVNPNVMNDSSLERNMQSTQLISSKRKHNKKQLENDEGTLNAQMSDLIKFSSEENVQECRKQEQVLKQQEISSGELPVLLNRFGQSAEQTKLYQEVLSKELPVFLNNTISSNEILTNYETKDSLHLSSRNIDENEISSTELPQCIVDLRYSDSTYSLENNTNVAQNALSSKELPVTVLEYNE